MLFFVIMAFMASPALYASEYPRATLKSICDGASPTVLEIFDEDEVEASKKSLHTEKRTSSRIRHVLTVFGNDGKAKELYCSMGLVSLGIVAPFFEGTSTDEETVTARDVEKLDFFNGKLSTVPLQFHSDSVQELVVDNKGGAVLDSFTPVFFKNLRTLVLDYALNKVPEVEQLAHLESLRMRGTNLKGSEPEWWKLERLPLTALDLSVSPKLEVLPDVVRVLKLQSLKFSLVPRLDFEKTRAIFAVLTSLRTLKMRSLGLKHVPEELKSLPHLAVLSLAHNRGLEIHAFDWESLAALQRLNISSLGQTQLPSCFNRDLKEIVIDENSFNKEELQEVLAQSPGLKITPCKKRKVAYRHSPKTHFTAPSKDH